MQDSIQSSLIRFRIKINHGDNNTTTQFFFVHKNHEYMTEDEQAKVFDRAVKELDHIYKDYGRFATQRGIEKLFESFGFERTASN